MTQALDVPDCRNFGTIFAMSMTLRRDAMGGLAAPVSARVFEGRVARVHMPGDPLRYPWGSEHRDATELARMVEKMPGKPVIVLHPKNKKHLRDGGVAKIVGRIMHARVDGNHAVAQIVLFDDDGVTAIKNGVRELSLGYDARCDANGFQRNVDIDHLALVPAARCGATCEVRYDADGNAIAEDVADALEHVDADLTAAARHSLSPSEFAAPSTHSLPIEDAVHVRDAMSRFGETHFANPAEKRGAYEHIVSRAKALGIDTSGFQSSWSARLDTVGDQECTCTKYANGHVDAVPAVHGTSASGAPKDKTSMDELTQKQLAMAMADAASQKARADQADKDRDAAIARADQADKDRDAARVTASDAAKDLDAAKARADKAESDAKSMIEKARQDANDTFSTRVDARVELLANAKPIIGLDAEGKPVDLVKLSDREIMTAVAKRVDGEDIGLDESLDYVKGMYRGALKRAGEASASVAAVRTAVVTSRRDAAPLPTLGTLRAEEDAARLAMDSSSNRAWSAPRNRA